MSKTHYQRSLPHIHPPGETLFVTFRLAGSLPAEKLRELRAEQLREEAVADTAEQLISARKRHFVRWDAALHRAEYGPDWLKQAAVAGIVAEEIHQLTTAEHRLWSFCLMPNHVHLVVSLPEGAAVFYKTMQQLKGRAAYRCNRLLGRTGIFWQPESYDHVVRNGEEMQNIMAYVLENPVKAGLVEDWQQWPHTYLNPAY